jgi:hypothetical protein
MTIYKKRHASSLKWILAIIIFVLGMTLTMSDAYGFNFPYCGGGSGGYNYGGWGSGYGGWCGYGGWGNNHWYNNNDCGGYNYDHNWNNGGDCNGGDNGGDQPPCNVPEPSTILLLAGGLGAIYVTRRNRVK